MKAIDEVDQLVTDGIGRPVLDLAVWAIDLDREAREIRAALEQLENRERRFAIDRARFSSCIDGVRAFFIGRRVGDQVRAANAPVADAATEPSPDDLTH